MAERQQVETTIESSNVGHRLRAAREAAGLSRAEVAAITKIPERHLASMEAGNFAALAGRSYALGFSRTYARAVGLDEKETAQAVRQEIDARESDVERGPAAAFEPGDPSRVPSRRTAWLAALVALAFALAGFFFWRSYYVPAEELPSLVVTESSAPATPAKPKVVTPSLQPPAQQPPAQGPVTFTALEDGIWVKFYDATGRQLMQKEMALGESYTVPADATGPLLRTARPDALRISVGGKDIPRLSDRGEIVADVPVSAAALLARANPSGAPARAPASPSPPRAALPRRATPTPGVTQALPSPAPGGPPADAAAEAGTPASTVSD